MKTTLIKPCKWFMNSATVKAGFGMLNFIPGFVFAGSLFTPILNRRFSKTLYIFMHFYTRLYIFILFDGLLVYGAHGKMWRWYVKLPTWLCLPGCNFGRMVKPLI